MQNKDLSQITQSRLRLTLETHLDSTQAPSTLIEALKYVLFPMGKAFRAQLVYGTGLGLGLTLEQLDPLAASIETMHAYSLVHDDLPAMDDDDIRRGKPSCHKAFSEATAILVGDGLQSLAFEILTHTSCQQTDLRSLIKSLAQSAGHQGMVGGQFMDMNPPSNPNINDLISMHQQKTGRLIGWACSASAFLLPNADLAKKLDHWGQKLGLLFQIQDDILDATQTTEILGKPSGSDATSNKCTYVSLLGLTQARQKADDCHKQLLDELQSFAFDTFYLQNLLKFTRSRQN